MTTTTTTDNAEAAGGDGAKCTRPLPGGDVNNASNDGLQESLRALHADAVRASDANRGNLYVGMREQDRRRAEEFRNVTHLAGYAQDCIFNDILKGLRDKVMQAADAGFRSANILEFNGFDQYVLTGLEGGTTTFLWVFLVLGPRQHEHWERRQVQRFGYRPLLAKLQDKLGGVFGVKHYHNRSTNVNQIRITWGRQGAKSKSNNTGLGGGVQ